MRQATIYTARSCPYCNAAKAILQALHVDFREVDISGNWEARDEMISRANGNATVPQIFLGDSHIGGFKELKALQDSGTIERYL